MRNTASFLFSVRFVSDAARLRSLLCLVCRSSDSSIQAARLIAACDLAPYCQRIASAFSPGHDSPSNDRFSPHAGISRMENNTLESQLLSESCRVLAISNVQTANLRWIPSVSGICTRFPCSANKHACPICRVRQGQSFHLDEAASVLRVAHVPQKPWYVILGTIAVGFGGSACALRLGFSAVVSIPAKAGETLQKVCPSIRCANWDQNHSETVAFDLPTVLLPRFAQAKPG